MCCFNLKGPWLSPPGFLFPIPYVTSRHPKLRIQAESIVAPSPSLLSTFFPPAFGPHFPFPGVDVLDRTGPSGPPALHTAAAAREIVGVMRLRFVMPPFFPPVLIVYLILCLAAALLAFAGTLSPSPPLLPLTLRPPSLIVYYSLPRFLVFNDAIMDALSDAVLLCAVISGWFGCR